MEEILDAIAASKILVFVSSKHSNESIYTCGEILEAIDRGMHIIPVKIDDSPYNKKYKLVLNPYDFIDYKAKPITALRLLHLLCILFHSTVTWSSFSLHSCFYPVVFSERTL